MVRYNTLTTPYININNTIVIYVQKSVLVGAWKCIPPVIYPLKSRNLKVPCLFFSPGENIKYNTNLHTYEVQGLVELFIDNNANFRIFRVC